MGRMFHPGHILTIPREQHIEKQKLGCQPSLEEMLAGVLFLPQLPHCHNKTGSSDYPPCCKHRQMCRSTLPVMKNQWIHVVDMGGFRPCDIKVKTEGHTLIVNARREDSMGENIDVIERKRVVSIPDGVDKKKITCRCNQAGHFIIMGTYSTENRKPEESCEPVAPSNGDHNKNTVEEKSGPATELVRTENEERAAALDDVNQTNLGDDINPCNNVYIVSESLDVSDVDSDKQSLVSTADCSFGGENTADSLGDRGSPILSEDFVILDNQRDDAKADLVFQPEVDIYDVDKTHIGETESSVQKDCNGNKSLYIKLSLKEFPADCINIRCKNNSLFVDAKHEWKDGDMIRSQAFHKQYQLPDNAKKTDARACIDSDGMFTIIVPLKKQTS